LTNIDELTFIINVITNKFIKNYHNSRIILVYKIVFRSFILVVFIVVFVYGTIFLVHLVEFLIAIHQNKSKCIIFVFRIIKNRIL
jgi:hypothetical protein